MKEGTNPPRHHCMLERVRLDWDLGGVKIIFSCHFLRGATEQPTTQFTVRRQRLFGEQSPVSLLYHSVGGFLKLSFYQWLYYLRSSNHLCQVIKYSIDTVCFMRNEIYLPEYVAQEILSSGKYSLATVLFVFLNFF